jgi:asparagine synthase (glutamine-hydrolysing)
MCGIAGFLASQTLPATANVVLQNMSDAIIHRGPDDGGAWIDAAAGIALGQRRLSIIDLSPAGHQPMLSASGRHVIVFNGEIYNYEALRRELEAAGAAPAWRGHSDTEVLLAAVEYWGIEKTLERLDGMFALALWDRREETLCLARDRLGEKPLYYGFAGNLFLFGSEVKALRAHPAFDAGLDRDSLAQYLRFGCVPGERSIWQGVRKLPPAHFLVLRRGARAAPAPQCYWDFRAVAERGSAAPLADTPELVDMLEARLKAAVGSRMVADVPLGAFLSGGVDSSMLVALMQAQSARPVRTFTIGFYEQGYDEAVYAKAVAEHLGTEHTELYLTSQDALALIPKLPAIWDEPFADASQIPTYLVSEMTRQHVTVSLSGDGGDELFGGYYRHFLATKLWRYSSRVPRGLKRPLARLLDSPKLGAVINALGRGMPPRLRQMAVSDRLPKLALLLEADTPKMLYRNLLSHWPAPDDVVIGGSEPESLLDGRHHAFGSPGELMMYLDTLSYLPDDILVKVDRASMAVGLEARAPYLDHHLVEFAWQLPMSAKISAGKGKHILRQLLARYVPEHLTNRPKTGFAVPINDWLAGPLRDWAEDLLSEQRLRQDGYLDAARVRAVWRDHKSGIRSRQLRLWNILMFQAWLEQQKHVPAGAAPRMPCPDGVTAAQPAPRLPS